MFVDASRGRGGDLLMVCSSNLLVKIRRKGMRSTYVQIRAIPSSDPVASNEPEGYHHNTSVPLHHIHYRETTYIPSNSSNVSPPLRTRMFANDIVLNDQPFSIRSSNRRRSWNIPNTTGRITSTRSEHSGNFRCVP